MLSDLISANVGKSNDLVACIFTASIPRALRLAKQLDAGNVNINTSQVFSANVPFGGAKQSGLGREGGRVGLMNYLEAKTISIKYVESSCRNAQC